MTDTSKALELADELEMAAKFPAYPKANYAGAAAELRRQHAEIAELKAELERIRSLQPVAWRSSMGHGVTFKESLTADQIAFKWAGAPMWQPLFTLPPNLKGPVETYDQKELDEAAARAKEIVAGLKIE